ncbi:MAG: ferredoxin [Muribaculaceae bacterium]|nr:ferredoxin [Muribaculaceae bacterium]
MIINERQSRHEHVLAAACQIMTAARTAPKGKGIDIIEIALIEGDDLKRLSDKMIAMVDVHGMKFFLRDADNILQSECVVVIGTHSHPQGLNCGHCGFDTCVSKPAEIPCAINSADVGIAIGSACATAADLRLDSRVMFSAGLAAQQLEILPGCKQVYAIALSASSKSPFFDRKPKQ